MLDKQGQDSPGCKQSGTAGRKPLKVLSISDWIVPDLYRNFDAGRFSRLDLILACGDLPPEYLSFLASRTNAPLFFIRGNHDFRYDSNPPAGCRNIDTRLVRFKGWRFLGLEGSRWYNGNPYQYTESQMRSRIRRLRMRLWWQKGVDIVITHAPPRFIKDAEDPCHKGFRCFRTFIDRYRPRYFIHGHIHSQFSHPSHRTTWVNTTRVINTTGYYLFQIEESDKREPHPQMAEEKRIPKTTEEFQGTSGHGRGF